MEWYDWILVWVVGSLVYDWCVMALRWKHTPEEAWLVWHRSKRK